MRFTLLRTVTIIIVTVIGISCGHESHDRSIQINKFPIESYLKYDSGQVLDIPSIGIMEINTFNDKLIVSTSESSALWQIYSLPEVDSIGSIFRPGAGPGELIEPTPSIIASFYSRKEDNHVMCIIPQMMSGKFVAGDLTDNISKDTVINNKIGPMTMMAYRLDDLRWFNIEIVPDSCKIRRSIIGNAGKVMANQAIDSLNHASVRDMSQIPLLMFRPIISANGLWVAEIGGYKPEINIWNSRTGESNQIIYQDIDDSYSAMRSRLTENKPLFQGGIALDNFFAVQRYNGEGGINIDFFRWNGRPAATLSLDYDNIRRFAIDIKNGDLYCLDADRDVIIKFPIRDFLSQLKK